MERNRMLMGSIMLTIFAIAFLWAGSKGMHLSNRYNTEGVDVVVTIEEVYRVGKSHYVHGSYTYDGKKYTGVSVTNYPNAKVGEKVDCKVLLDDKYRADYAGTEKNIFAILLWLLTMVFVVAAVLSIVKYVRYCRVIDHGLLGTGVVKSVQKKEREFYGLVEFEDLRGNKYTVELCFGSAMKVVGQQCALKYVIDSKGHAEAYYYDNRRLM